MKRFFGNIHLKLTTIIAVILILSNFIGGCSTATGEGFAIYLTKEDIPPAQMEALSHVDLAEQPVLAMQDIIAYYGRTHEISLTTDAFNRISNLEVPVSGRSFMVCVDRQPVYWGAFWTPISSLSFDGVTIWKPLSPQHQQVIKIELGYPSSSFYEGEDPRNNVEVMRSLEQTGKLVTEPSAVIVDELPRSAKGYELYSWPENGQWHFTLITGTNRNKTLDEIISYVNIISEEGWVKIHVLGTSEIKTILSKLPQNEYVFWIGRMGWQTEEPDTRIQLPPDQMVEDVKEFAVQCGLNLAV